MRFGDYLRVTSLAISLLFTPYVANAQQSQNRQQEKYASMRLNFERGKVIVTRESPSGDKTTSYDFKPKVPYNIFTKDGYQFNQPRGTSIGKKYDPVGDAGRAVKKTEMDIKEKLRRGIRVP